MAADTITIPRDAAFEAASFLEAICHELQDLGADSDELWKLQAHAYEPIALALNAGHGGVEVGEALEKRGRELAERMATLVDLNFARRLTKLEDKRDEFEVRLAVLEERR